MKPFRPGNMGIANAIAITFIYTFPTVFLSTPALELQNSASLAWLDVLVHGTVSIALMMVVFYVCWHIPGDLFAVIQQLLGLWPARLISLYYAVAFFLDYVLILRQYAENTLLTALPYSEFSIIIAAYATVVSLLVYIGVEGLSRTTYLLMPFTIIALILVLLMLAPFYNIYRLAPFGGNGIGTSLLNGLRLVGTDFGIIVIAMLAPSFQNIRTMAVGTFFGVALSTMMRSLSVLVFTLVFGVTVGREKVLPFFEMARTAYISRYLQRVESLFIILWVISGALALAIDLYGGLYCLARLVNLPTIRPLIPVITVILAEAAMMPPDIYTVIYLFSSSPIQMFYNAAAYGLPLLLLLALIIKKKGKVKVPWATGKS